MGNPPTQSPGTGSTGTSAMELTDQEAQRIGQSVRDQVNQELESKFRNANQINPTELRDVTQQINYTKIVKDAFRSSSGSGGTGSGR